MYFLTLIPFKIPWNQYPELRIEVEKVTGMNIMKPVTTPTTSKRSSPTTQNKNVHYTPSKQFHFSDAYQYRRRSPKRNLFCFYVDFEPKLSIECFFFFILNQTWCRVLNNI